MGSKMCIRDRLTCLRQIIFYVIHSCIPLPRLLSWSWVKVKCRSKVCEGQPLCHSALLCCLVSFYFIKLCLLNTNFLNFTSYQIANIMLSLSNCIRIRIASHDYSAISVPLEVEAKSCFCGLLVLLMDVHYWRCSRSENGELIVRSQEVTVKVTFD